MTETLENITESKSPIPVSNIFVISGEESSTLIKMI